MSREMIFTGPHSGGQHIFGDPLGYENIMPGGILLDANAFGADDRVIVQANGITAAGAVSMVVDPIPAELPANVVLTNAAGTKFVRTSAVAAKNAVAIPVYATAEATVDNEVFTYAGTGPVRVPQGTVIGRTFVERDAGAVMGPAVDADDEVFLLAFGVDNARRIADGELYRHGRVVYENRIPGFAALSAALKTKLRASYHMMLARETV